MGRPRRTASGRPRSPDIGWLGSKRLLLGLFVVAVSLGGGGITVGYFNLAVQVLCLAGLGLIGPSGFARFCKSAPRGLLVLAALTIALPAIQLIPLPPAVWSSLPGRGIVSQSLALVSAQGAWMPLSVDPNRTAIALFAVLACLPIVMLCASVDRRVARLVPLALAILGLCAAVFGALQLSQGNQNLVLQPRGVIRHQLYANFANHNATGLFFVICLVCLAGIKASWLEKYFTNLRRSRDFSDVLAARVRVLKLGLGLLFALCTVLTQSRSALLILAVVLVWLTVRARARICGGVARVRAALGPRLVLVALAGVVLLVGGAAGVAGNRAVQNSFARFQKTDDPRLHIWNDARSTMTTYMPVGAGIGAFDAVFQLDESLEVLDPLKATRAHCDYLEALVESGVAGLLLILAWGGWIAMRTWRARRDGGQAVTACAVMLCIAIQSAVDYPLRNMAMLVIAAAMIGLLARPLEEPVNRSAQ